MVSPGTASTKRHSARFLQLALKQAVVGTEMGGFKRTAEARRTRRCFLFLEQISERVIGAAIEVHRTLGPGLLESIYEFALAEEFQSRGIPFERQKAVPIRYKDLVLDGGLRLDFVVAGEVVVELKSVERLIDIHQSQLVTYLRLTGCRVGLLINFNVLVLKHGIRRIVLGAPD